MTPKADHRNQHNDDMSAEGSWRGEEENTKNNQAAIEALRSLGLLRPSPSTTISRVVMQSATTPTSWYCSSSDDDDDNESGFGDESDSDDDDEDNRSERSELSHECGFYKLSTGPLTGIGIGGGRIPTPAEERARKAKEAKNAVNEKVAQSNIQRRSIKFSNDTNIKEFEPAPTELYGDLYYSCHQLQKMIDEANAEKEAAAMGQ